AILPLASVVDLLRWPLGLSSFWFLQLLWIILLIALVSVLAWRQIYPQLFR
ncbi:MAG TPA: ABC transporter, partial [Cyanobacteria bacterium UBA11159]|nr:ABC transporter [Cyanobacteria bacterium UBA11159]